jgi:hypothetical protein
MNLDGYWLPIAKEGKGRIGALISVDHITLYPATAADIQQVIQPRTSTSAGEPPREHAELRPGTMKSNFLAIQTSREPFVPCDQFMDMIERHKMTHVATDGGARPNPGSAGWGALIRQNSRCTYNWGHYDTATSNAMELMAVI